MEKIISLPPQPRSSLSLLPQEVKRNEVIRVCATQSPCKKNKTPTLAGIPISRTIRTPFSLYEPGGEFFLVHEDTFAQFKTRARIDDQKRAKNLSAPEDGSFMVDYHTAYWHPPLDQLSTKETAKAIQLVSPTLLENGVSLMKFSYFILAETSDQWLQALRLLALITVTTLSTLVGSNFLISRMYTDIQRQRYQYKKLMRMGLTRAEMRRSVTAQIAIFFFAPLVFSIGLATLFIVYFGRAIRSIITEAPASATGEGSSKLLSWQEIFGTTGQFFSIFLLVEVCIFLVARFWITRSLQRVMTSTK